MEYPDLKEVTWLPRKRKIIAIYLNRHLRRWFTYYERSITVRERRASPEAVCKLVGFNLGDACFNLDEACVLLRKCTDLTFDPGCETCKVRHIFGERPCAYENNFTECNNLN